MGIRFSVFKVLFDHTFFPFYSATLKSSYNCRVRKYFFVTIAFTLLLSACGLNISVPSSGTATPFIITATLPPTPIPPPTLTPIPPTPSPTLAPVKGTTSTQLNVRGDPSTSGAPLGMIAPFAQVQIIGKDSSGIWYQIIYPQGIDGKGWIVAQYVQVDNATAIPTVADAATPSPTEAAPSTSLRASTGSAPNVDTTTVQADGTLMPTSIPPTMTPTLIPAPQDGDSAQSPAVNITFSPSGSRSLIYSSDVSAPQGDAEDWIQFTPYGSSVIVNLMCVGNGTLKVDLQQNGTQVQNWNGLSCGETKQVDVLSGKVYLMSLAATSTSGQLQYVHYTLSIATPP